MGTISWLLPMIMSMIGTGVSAGVSASNANKQLAFQEKQLEQQNQLAKDNAEQARNQQQILNQQTADNFKRSMNIAGNSSTITNSMGIGIQGLNSQQGYLTEEDETAYARCGGRFKKAFGGKNKVDSASIYVSPNNIPVKTDSNSVIGYRDRLAQFKLGGRKC